MDARLKDLYFIQEHDPEQYPAEPTQADLDGFRRWVIARFGKSMWVRYNRGGWAQS